MSPDSVEASIRINDGLLLNWKYWNIASINEIRIRAHQCSFKEVIFNNFLSLNVLEYVRKAMGIYKYYSEIKMGQKYWCWISLYPIIPKHYFIICSNRVVPERHYHCGWHSYLLITTSLDNILNAGDPVEGYDISAIAGPPTNHTTTILAMARLVSITVMMIKEFKLTYNEKLFIERNSPKWNAWQSGNKFRENITFNDMVHNRLLRHVLHSVVFQLVPGWHFTQRVY